MKKLFYLLLVLSIFIVGCNQSKVTHDRNVIKTENWSDLALDSVSKVYSELITLDEYKLTKVNTLYQRICQSELDKLMRGSYILGGNDSYLDLMIAKSRNEIPNKVKYQFDEALSYLYFRSVNGSDLDIPKGNYSKELISDYNLFRYTYITQIKLDSLELIQDTPEILSASFINVVNNYKYIVTYQSDGYPNLSKVNLGN